MQIDIQRDINKLEREMKGRNKLKTTNTTIGKSERSDSFYIHFEFIKNGRIYWRL